VQDHHNLDLPPFPSPPEGFARIEHLPTIKACIQYWESVRIRATRGHNPNLAFTAESLRSAYEQAHQELTRVDTQQKTAAASRTQRARFRRTT
jgi:hypothetical protein